MSSREEHQRQLILRLRRIEGQIRGIQGMIGEEDECERIAQQLCAARRALDKTFHALVACQLEHDMHGAESAQEISAASQRMTALLSRYG